MFRADLLVRPLFPKLAVSTLAVLLLAWTLVLPAHAAELARVSRADYLEGETQPGHLGYESPIFSADGRFLLFGHLGTAVVAGQVDRNGRPDLFVRDFETRTTRLISHRRSGANVAANGGAESRGFSADGRYALFTSLSSDLLPLTAIAPTITYRYDLETGIPQVVAHRANQPLAAVHGGDTQVAMSADGRFVAFATPAAASFLDLSLTDTNGEPDLLLWDGDTDTVTLVTRRFDQAATAAIGRLADRPPVLSGDGRFVAYISADPALVANYAPSFEEVFLFDRESGATTLVSRPTGAAGTVSNSGSDQICALTGDGRFLLFASGATNLAAGADTNHDNDLFLYDHQAGAAQRITSAPSTGAAANGRSGCGWLSEDGRYVYFTSEATDLVPGASDEPGTVDLFVHDRELATTRLVSHAAGNPNVAVPWVIPAKAPLSADGSKFLLSTYSTALYTGSHQGPSPWGLVYDRATDSFTPAGGGTSALDLGTAHAIDASGRVIAFATTMPSAFVAGAIDRDGPVLLTRPLDGPAELAVPAVRRGSGSPSSPFHFWLSHRLSNDGSKVAFETLSREICGTGFKPLCLFDRATHSLTNINHRFDDPATASGAAMTVLGLGGPRGRYVLVESEAASLSPSDGNRARDLFLYDSEQRSFELISRKAGQIGQTANGESAATPTVNWQTLSWGAERVAFQSTATDLVAGLADSNGRADVFLRDRAAGSTVLVSRKAGSPGVAANGESLAPTLSGPGGFVVYESSASDLVAGFADGNGAEGRDLYLFDATTGQTRLISHAAGAASQGGDGDAAGAVVFLSADGRFVAYTHRSSNLIAGGSDSNGVPDVFLYDRSTGQNTLVSHQAGQPLAAANGGGKLTALSGDGRYVVFVSASRDLAPGVANGYDQAYLWDRLAGRHRLISHLEGQPNVPFEFPVFDARLSRDGARLLLDTAADGVSPRIDDWNWQADLYALDLATGLFELLSPRLGAINSSGGGNCSFGAANALSDDGRVALTHCVGSDLAENDNNTLQDLLISTSGPPFFADGFESGTTGAWSAAVP